MSKLSLILLLFIGFFGYSAKAQLILKGSVYSYGPVRATISAEGDKAWQQVYLNNPRKVGEGDAATYVTKYELPYNIPKDKAHTIRFTDGVVEKVIFICGSVPEDITPKQKYLIDIDLLDDEATEEKLMVFWSSMNAGYFALPVSDINELVQLSQNDGEY